MTFRRISVLLTSLLLISGCSQRTPEQQFLHATTSQVIQPAYRDLAKQSQLLLATITEHCPTDDDASRTQWRNTMASWQRIQAIQFGPIRDLNLAWEIQFWPDKKNLVARKNRSLLQEEQAITLERLQKASVASRGLWSLEYLLFDAQTKTLSTPQRRCQLQAAAAENLASVTQQLSAAWDEKYAAVLTTPGETNDDFPASGNAIAAIIDSYLTHLEIIKGRKLAPALGINNRAKRSNPYLLESWRSQHSLTNLRLNLEALQRLMHQGGLEDFLMAKQQPQLAAEINAHLQQLLEKLPAAEAGLFTLIKEQDVDAITAVYQQLPELIALFKRELPGKLDLQMGFNSNDGD